MMNNRQSQQLHVYTLVLQVTLLFLLPNLFVVALSTNAVVTPSRKQEELRTLAFASRRKMKGSMSSFQAWRHWSKLTIQQIRSDLEQSLATRVDTQALEDLSFSLGVAADVGAMPSFANEGARAGYAVHYFCRAQLMADLMLFSSESHFLQETVDNLFGSNKTCRISSLGGGPGFDFVAAALLASYQSQQQQQQGTPPTTLQATIFDYQEGWSPLVEKMSESVHTVLGGSHSCDFERCDITVPLLDPVNAACRQDITRNGHLVLFLLYR